MLITEIFPFYYLYKLVFCRHLLEDSRSKIQLFSNIRFVIYSYRLIVEGLSPSRKYSGRGEGIFQ